ncbi:MAG TPA: rhodanese-like domain-containing protein [Phycisphaerae bacterium]|nr:rhodanese-like domain-containing protein [Phycisphaerae bacterium]
MTNITADNLKEMQDRGEDFTLINVLSEQDFDKSHIPDSINIPVSSPDFEEQVERHAESKSADVVVYCASITCDASKKAARRLEAAGFTNVFTYEGGTKGWQEAGLPLEGSAAMPV